MCEASYEGDDRRWLNRPRIGVRDFPFLLAVSSDGRRRGEREARRFFPLIPKTDICRWQGSRNEFHAARKVRGRAASASGRRRGECTSSEAPARTFRRAHVDDTARPRDASATRRRATPRRTASTTGKSAQSRADPVGWEVWISCVHTRRAEMFVLQRSILWVPEGNFYSRPSGPLMPRTDRRVGGPRGPPIHATGHRRTGRGRRRRGASALRQGAGRTDTSVLEEEKGNVVRDDLTRGTVGGAESRSVPTINTPAKLESNVVAHRVFVQVFLWRRPLLSPAFTRLVRGLDRCQRIGVIASSSARRPDKVSGALLRRAL